jgi:hypothetical protein
LVAVAHNIQLDHLQYFHPLLQVVVDQVVEKAGIAQLMRVGLVDQAAEMPL